MTVYSWLALYCSLVMLFSLLGGYLPFIGRVTHSRLQFYLSASAGVMLGASFFHVMPDAIEAAGPAWFGWWISIGVVGLFCIERFIAPHSHELDGGKHEHAGHQHHHGGGEHGPGCGHHHDHDHGPALAVKEPQVAPPPAAVMEPRPVAPPVAGWMAVIGLTIHTFMNGVGLAGAVHGELEHVGGAPLEHVGKIIFPGLAMFLAIVLHKPADALAISTVLRRKGVSSNGVLLVQFLFASTVAVGAVAFLLTSGAINETLQNQLTGAALSFSAGTFLFIALSDLLPEVQFHRHDRLPLFLTLAAGVVFMGMIAALEGHEGHEHGGHDHGAAEKAEGHAGHHHDDHDRDSDHDRP